MGFIFTGLPIDAIHLILQFYGRIRYWKGKYSNIFAENDERFDILSTIPRPHKVSYFELYSEILPEHFEVCVHLGESKFLRVWCISNPPKKITYFYYSNLYTNFYILE
jgi:hypothetical protein